MCEFEKSDHRLPSAKDSKDSLSHDHTTCNTCKDHVMNLKTLQKEHLSSTLTTKGIEKVCITAGLANKRAIDANVCSVRVEMNVELLQQVES